MKIVFKPPKKAGRPKGLASVYHSKGVVRGFRLYRLFREQGLLTTKDVIKEFGISTQSAKNYLFELREEGFIRKLPHGSGGRYDKYVLADAWYNGMDAPRVKDATK